MNDADIRYFQWLVKRVGGFDREWKRYEFLLSLLHSKEFYWVITNDQNRSDDGIALRDEFIEMARIKPSETHLLAGPCSVLEMLVGFAVRIERDVMANVAYDDRTGDWFWEMLSNMDLTQYDDTSIDAFAVEVILDKFMDRDYDPDGTGSPFRPIKETLDQDTKIEIMELWGQMSIYFMDK